MSRLVFALALALALLSCKPQAVVPDCANGSVLDHANSSCSLGGVIVDFADANSIYNPASDCQVQGSGPVCPSQAELRLNSDPSGPATLLVISLPTNRFNLACSSSCSMVVKLHYTVESGNIAAPRLNSVGGSGPFDVLFMQWVAGATGKAECNPSGCGGGAADPACQAAAPYCTVAGSPANYTAAGAQATTATLGVSCGKGGCTTQANSFGLHHGQH